MVWEGCLGQAMRRRREISGTLTRDLLVLGEERRQLENLQVMFQQDLWLVGGLAHAEVPSISAA
jgi:hypothetical protein